MNYTLPTQPTSLKDIIRSIAPAELEKRYETNFVQIYNFNTDKWYYYLRKVDWYDITDVIHYAVQPWMAIQFPFLEIDKIYLYADDDQTSIVFYIF